MEVIQNFTTSTLSMLSLQRSWNSFPQLVLEKVYLNDFLIHEHGASYSGHACRSEGINLGQKVQLSDTMLYKTFNFQQGSTVFFFMEKDQERNLRLQVTCPYHGIGAMKVQKACLFPHWVIS